MSIFAPTTPPDRPTSKAFQYAPVFVFLASGLFLMLALGTVLLRSWDEAIYAQVAREMLQTKDYLNLHYLGLAWFEKPPLFFWLTTVAYKIFGVNEASARLVPVLFSAGTATIIFLYARRFFGTFAGLAGAATLLTTEYFYSLSRQGVLDPLLTFFFVLIVYLDNQPRSLRNWLWIGVAAGLAILSKGAAAIIVPFYLLISLGLKKELAQELRKKGFWLAILLALVVAVPWHVVEYLRYGAPFFHTYLGYHVIQRATGSIEGHPGGLAYYLKVLFTAFSPWFLLALPALAWLSSGREKRAGISLLTGILVVLLFYSLVVQSKLNQYILPMIPLLAASVGVYVAAVVENKLEREHRNIVIGAALLAPLFTQDILVSNQHHRLLLLGFSGLVVLLGLVWKFKAQWLPAFSAGVLLFCALGTVYYSATRPSDATAAMVAHFSQVHARDYAQLPSLGTLPTVEPAEYFYGWPSNTGFYPLAKSITQAQQSPNHTALYFYPQSEAAQLAQSCAVKPVEQQGDFQLAVITCP